MNKRFLAFFFFYNGVISLTLLFTLIIESNYINIKFPNFDYNFQIPFPNYTCVPLGILLTKWSSKFHMSYRIIIGLGFGALFVLLTMIMTVSAEIGSLNGILFY